MRADAGKWCGGDCDKIIMQGGGTHSKTRMQRQSMPGSMVGGRMGRGEEEREGEGNNTTKVYIIWMSSPCSALRSVVQECSSEVSLAERCPERRSMNSTAPTFPDLRPHRRALRTHAPLIAHGP